MESRLRKKRITTTALISFTDVIFLLIIFLLISSSFVTQSGIKVKLPVSSSRQNEFYRNIDLTLTREGEVYIDNDYVSWEDLATVLNNKLIADPEQIVVVRADEDIALKELVHLLDVAKLSGTNRFFIATELHLQEEENEN